MKHKLILFVVIGIFIGCSSPQALLRKGVEQNDLNKVSQALSKGALFKDEYLSKAIRDSNLSLLDLVVGKEVSPEDGLIIAAKENRTEIVKYMFKKGAKGILSVKSIIGQVYLVDKKDDHHAVPIKIFVDINLDPHWRLEDSSANPQYQSHLKAEDRNSFKYKTDILTFYSPAILYAIDSNNVEMIRVFFSHGFSVDSKCVLNKCYDVQDYFEGYNWEWVKKNVESIESESGFVITIRESDGYILTNYCPTPNIIMTPLEHAKINNASGIVEMFSKLSNSK